MTELSLDIFGVKIKVSFWFAAIVTLYALVFESSLAVLLSVLLHECAHIIFIYIFGERVRAVDLRISDINISSELNILSKPQRVIIALAGPAANLLACGSGIIFEAPEFFAINLIISIFQLLPVTGSDGGTVVALLTKPGSRVPIVVSFTVSVIIFLLGFLLLIKFRFSYSLLIAGLYLIFMTCKSLA